MKLSLTKIPTPTLAELKKFIFLLSGFIAIVFGCLASLVMGKILIWPWIVSILLTCLYFINANLLIPVYKGWMMISEVWGHFTSQAVLVLIFFLLVTPMGLIFQLVKRNKSAKPEWIDSNNAVQNDFERPY